MHKMSRRQDGDGWGMKAGCCSDVAPCSIYTSTSLILSQKSPSKVPCDLQGHKH